MAAARAGARELGMSRDTVGKYIKADSPPTKLLSAKAAELGPSVADFAERLFDGPLPWARVRQGHKLIRLGERYTPECLDAACRKALEVDLIDVNRVERILLQALEQQETTPSCQRRRLQAASPALAMSSPTANPATPVQPIQLN